MITIYHNPRCSKSRKALEILTESGAQVEVKEYLKDGVTAEELTKLQVKLGVSVLEFTRQKEDEFKALNIDWNNNDLAMAELIKTPKLLERPIVVNGDKAVVARPPELVHNIL